MEFTLLKRRRYIHYNIPNVYFKTTTIIFLDFYTWEDNKVRELATVFFDLMMLTYQRFTAVLLLIYGSLFLSDIYYCLRVFWCAAARMSELELEQRTNIKFLVVS